MIEANTPFLETKDDIFELFERLGVTVKHNNGVCLEYKGILEIINIPDNNIILYNKFSACKHELVDLNKVVLIRRLPMMYNRYGLRKDVELELKEHLKECDRYEHNKHNRKYYKNNKDKVLAYIKKYNEANKDKIKAYQNKYRQNKDVKNKLNLIAKEYYIKNRTSILAKAKIKNKKVTKL